MKVLGKCSIVWIGEFPSSQRSTRLGGVTSLRGGIAPIRCDCANDHVITLLEELYIAAYFVYNTHRFVCQGHILSRANGTAHRLKVRGTNEGLGRFHPRV